MNVNRLRRTTSLLFTAVLMAMSIAACGTGEPSKPDLPASVSPGWALQKMDISQPPIGLPSLGGTPPVCWKADYKAEDMAEIWVCGYRASGSAFEAAQKMQSGAHAVKIQKGRYLVAARWGNVSQAGITALLTAIQKQLPSD
jgi:hypothetical protein